MLVQDKRVSFVFDQLSCISSVSTTDRYLRDLENQFGDHGSLRYTVIDLGVDSLGEFARQAQFQQIVMVMITCNYRVR